MQSTPHFLICVDHLEHDNVILFTEVLYYP